jgi:carbon-monoxide dehydrogenase medium subunit
MIPSTFSYERATSLDDALGKLQASQGKAKLIAGGHSLVPLMKLRLSEPAMLVDIRRVPELSGIRANDGLVEIGAGTVHHDVASSALLRSECPVIAETAAEIGDPQVRHWGTLGGSLAHADPAADYPATLLALDADIQLKGQKGWRVVKAADFFRGPFSVDVNPDEIITAVRVRPMRCAAYAKLHQRASHFAIVGVAAALETSGGVIRSARVGLTGAAPFAVRLRNVEQALTGQRASNETVEVAAALAGRDLADVNADLHAGEQYRRAMIPVFTRRALSAALARS